MGPIASWWSSGLPRLVGRVARWLGEDADRVADQRSLAEMNYVHSTVNTVHLSRSAFNKGDGAAAAGPHPRRPVTPAPPTTATDRRLSSLCSPNPAPPGPLPPQSSPRQRVVAEVLADFTDRGSEFTSAACVAVCDRAGAAAFIGRTGSCRMTPSPSRYSPPQGELVDGHPLPHPHRSASLDLPLRWRARTDHLPVPGIARGGGLCRSLSPARPPTLESASAGRKPKRADGLVGAGCHAHVDGA